jgi:hypothetical protein
MTITFKDHSGESYGTNYVYRYDPDQEIPSLSEQKAYWQPKPQKTEEDLEKETKKESSSSSAPKST